jgi:hypothetical protein
MQPSDELVWKQEGLFEKLDSLESKRQFFPAQSTFLNLSTVPAENPVDQTHPRQSFPPASKPAPPVPDRSLPDTSLLPYRFVLDPALMILFPIKLPVVVKFGKPTKIKAISVGGWCGV